MLKRIFSVSLLLMWLAACVQVTPAAVATSTTIAPSQDWWRSAVFYEIFVRSFYDTNADGIGDFNGITEKLDYLESLGVNAIWLMPIHPSPSYHGYDVTDYYAVNPDYGTMEDFKEFLSEAHERDMHVIIDLVLNHTSSDHPWFQAANSDPNSEFRDYYVWSEQSQGSGWHLGDQGYYFGLFWEGMPDLNYRNPAVTTEMLKVTDFWLNEVGVDGFRVDAAKHLIEEGEKRENTPATHAWYRDFYPAYKAQDPNAYMVGEVFGAGSSVVKSYTGDQLDQIFNFEMASGFVNSVNGGSNSGVNSAVKFALQDMPDFNFATFLTNHDQNRAMSVFNGNVDKAKLAAFLMLTSPGTPFIYYGEEIGMSGVKPDEDIRLPMQWNAGDHAGFSTSTPWRPVAEDYQVVNVQMETGDPTSLLEHYRALLKLRGRFPLLQTGDLIPLDSGNSSMYAAINLSTPESLLILANLGDETVTDYSITLEGLEGSTYSVETVFGEDRVQRAPERNDAMFVPYRPFDALPPYSMYVLTLNPQ